MPSITVDETRDNVARINIGNRTISLVGTAHVSRASAELVEAVITEHRPDAICVELCPARYQSLKDPDRWKNTDIFEVIRSGRAYVLLTQLVLAAFQRRLAKQFGIRAGEEMLTAIRLSDEHNIPLSLVDRDVKVTLKRAWSRAGVFGLAKIAASFLTSFFGSEDISERELEELKQGDALAALMSEFSGVLPGVKVALIDERDRYMAAKIASTPGNDIVAIVGAGHVPGILDAIRDDSTDLTELERIPSPSLGRRLIGWSVPALLVGIIVFAFVRSGTKTGFAMLSTWAIANGTGAAIGTLVTGAHPLTILTAFVSAPFAAIHPLIAVGWICGLLECWLRKPNVQDFESLSDDLGSFRGWWHNRISHIFLVLILSNLGSVLGTVVGLGLAGWWLG